MFSSFPSANILSALMGWYNVRHVVVCPGSRNAPLVHNFSKHLTCHPVTDERSAGFYALGMTDAWGLPVAVCVTSGTALLNLAPAVAEAYYRKRPLLVISADRPAAWIDQLEAQTLPQPDALGRFVKKAVTLPEVIDEESHWHCNRLINEAMLALTRHGGGPVHINVPLHEPLFDFNTRYIPGERFVNHYVSSGNALENSMLQTYVRHCERMMIVVGQCRPFLTVEQMMNIKRHAVLLYEPLCDLPGHVCVDETLQMMKDELDQMQPEVVLMVGGCVVSKRLRQWLRSIPKLVVVAVSEDGEVRDTFMHQTEVIEATPHEVLSAIAAMPDSEKSKSFIENWEFRLVQTNLMIAQEGTPYALPYYTEETAVYLFERMVTEANKKFHVHYANSTAVRLGCRHAFHLIHVNRGVNGIEGSLSTAAGFSLVKDEPVFCVIGDLSFFYDSNALWPAQLHDNLRVLLLNNGGGRIFNSLPGLSESPVANTYISGSHQTSAQGICQSYNVHYRSAINRQELEEGLAWLTQSSQNSQNSLSTDRKSSRPRLLEVMFCSFQ